MRFVHITLAALAALTLCSTALQAAPTQFATFNLVTTNQPFTFTNNGGTSGNISAVNVPVLFDFTIGTGLPTGDHATLNLSTPGGPSTFTPASGGSTDVQPISNPTTLRILEDGTGKNLLTLLFTGNITGTDGGTTASLSGTDASGNLVAFTSDFGTFTQPGNSYNLSLTTVNPRLSIGPGGFLNSFIANISGSFTANFTPAAPPPPLVPEPGSIALLTGMGAVGAAFLRRRKQTQKAA